MPHPTRILVLLAMFFSATPLLAIPEPTADDMEHNRKQLAVLKQDPERMVRLRRGARAFAALPVERRQRILQLDHDLHAKSATVQTRLGAVLERHAEWMTKLPEEDR